MTYEPESAHSGSRSGAHHGDERLATLGGRLRAVRLAKGLTSEDVAAALGISRPTFTTWELDKVQNVDEDKINAFAKLAHVSAQWLKHATGKAPDINLDVPDRAFVGKRKATIAAMTAPPAPPTSQPLATGAMVVAEIKPVMSAHAKALDTAPQATWAIPREVLTLGFNCDPESAVITRVRVPFAMADGTPVARGDYLLIDGSRHSIDEPGLYYVADPDGREAKRAIASLDETTGALLVSIQGSTEPVNASELDVLGRAMAVFHNI